MKRRLIVCCDGTWNSLDMRYITNVGRLVQAVGSEGMSGNSKIPHVIYYDDGVGSDSRGVRRMAEGALGWGIDRLIEEAYRFIVANYQKGDEICLFGYSRGAYAVRSLAGLIGAVGVVPRSELKHFSEAMDTYRFKGSKEKKKQLREAYMDKANTIKARVNLLGCWDTVGALGVPDKIPNFPLDDWLRHRYTFHDEFIGSHIDYAIHAVAIDEVRKEFVVTPMKRPGPSQTKIIEHWFPGDHGCVGGGLWEKRGLSNRCLKWMIDQAKNAGFNLKADLTRLKDNAISDPHTYFALNHSLIYGRKHRSIPATAVFDHTAAQRWLDDPEYRPKQLTKGRKKQPKEHRTTTFAKATKNLKPTKKTKPASGSLRKNEHADIQVFADKPGNSSGISVKKNEKYEIKVSRLQVWKDGKLDPCDIRGWSLKDKNKVPYQDGEAADIRALRAALIRAGRSGRAKPSADWFELIFRIGDSAPISTRVPTPKTDDETTPFVIKFTAHTSGELFFGANDFGENKIIINKYKNNEGFIWARLTRV
ncbi:MAG: DUF2235 domain-containing protein [Planctomycetota bacterium]